MMNIKLKQTYKEMLSTLEKNSTCSRIKVASIIVKDGRIISTGWNGVPSGFKHCEQIFKIEDRSVCAGHTCIEMKNYFYNDMKLYSEEEFLRLHHEFSEKYEIHAEANAISFAAKNNISTEGASMFVSITPCSSCAKSIMASGIKKLYYKKVYDRSSDGFDLLKEAELKGLIHLEKI